MIHKLKTPPTAEPVTLDEMRAHLGLARVSDNVRDEIITARIISARLWCENLLNRSLITRTITAYDRRFPNGCCVSACEIELISPLQSVTSVKYLDCNGVEQTLSPSLYVVDTVSNCLIPAYGQSFPIARRQNNSVQIEYVSGYGNAAAVPEAIKDAIRFIVGQWEVFQSSIEGVLRPFTIPNAAKELLSPYIDMRGQF